MNFRPILILCVCAFFTQPAFCQEQTFPDENCAFVVPEGWIDNTKNVTLPGVIKVYSKPDETASIVLYVGKGGHPAAIEDDYAEGFERGVNKKGDLKLVSASFIEIQGIKAYRRIGEGTANGKPSSNLSLSIPTIDTLYCLSGTTIGGDVNKDPEIQKAFSSFRFLTIPEPAESSAYWQGYLAGKVLFFVLIGGIIFKVVSTRRKEKQNLKPTLLPPET